MLDIFEDTVGDSALDIELEAIKCRISELLTLLLTRLFKSKHPQASEEELTSFIQKHNVFLDKQEKESLDEEINSLEDALQEMLDSFSTVREEVKSGSTAPDYKGATVGAKSSDSSKVPTSKQVQDSTGSVPVRRDSSSPVARGSSAPDYSGKKKVSRQRETRKETEPTKADVIALFERVREDLDQLRGRQVAYRRRAIL